MPTVPRSEIERVFREEYGRAVAVLARVFGDIDIAEEAVQEAFAAALARWPDTGLPPAPAGWIITAPDLDAALGWARKATVACRLPVEVRPMVGLGS